MPESPQKILMILTSHRLDCLKLNLALLERNRILPAFDRVVFLLNGVEGDHLAYIRAFIAKHPGVRWDEISGPRGRSECISSLENQCVTKYPGNVYIKIDEDIFVPQGWADRMFEAYAAHRDNHRLALITPLIPNNAYGLWYLTTRQYPGLAAEFRERFGADPSPASDGATWRLPSVAEWAIRKFLDLAPANAALRSACRPENRYHRFKDRFSVGCVLFDYRHWQAMGGIPPKDEPEWCDWIGKHDHFNVLDTSVLVQHYSFFVQQDWLDRTTVLEDLTAVNLGLRLSPWQRHGPRLARFLPQIPGIVRRRLGVGAR